MAASLIAVDGGGGFAYCISIQDRVNRLFLAFAQKCVRRCRGQPMRIRFKSHDLSELAQLYRGAAAAERRRAEGMQTSSQAPFFIKQAIRLAERADKLESLSRLAEEFILQPATPFNGGPPALLVVGGSDSKDGSAFVGKRAGRKRA